MKSVFIESRCTFTFPETIPSNISFTNADAISDGAAAAPAATGAASDSPTQRRWRRGVARLPAAAKHDFDNLDPNWWKKFHPEFDPFKNPWTQKEDAEVIKEFIHSFIN